MNDGLLVVAGCTVSFIALCGVYVYVRESFIYSTPKRADQPLPKPSIRD